MSFEFNFTYAMQISLRSVNPLSYYIYMKTIIVIISKNKSKIKNSHEQNGLRIQFYICCTNFIRISEQIRDVTWDGDAIRENFIENDWVNKKKQNIK